MTWVCNTRTKAEERNSRQTSISFKNKHRRDCRNDSFECVSCAEAINLWFSIGARPPWGASALWAVSPQLTGLSMSCVLANSLCESGQRGDGQKLPGPKTAAAESSSPPHPHTHVSRQRESRTHPVGCAAQSHWSLWSALRLSYSWTRVSRTCGPYRRPCFQECFFWKDTCFAGLRSRWPEPLGCRSC